MPISIDNVAIFSAGGILGYLARTFIDHRLAKSRTEENRKIKEFNQAAATFRSKVLAELEGLYPSRCGWDREEYARFKKTIPKIETIAQEFRFHLERKKEFDTATYHYCNYCKQITWDQCAAWSLYPSMRKEDELPPWAKFDHLVKSLLTFADTI